MDTNKISAKEWMLRAKHLDIEINSLERERKAALERALSMTQPTDNEHISVSSGNPSEAKILKYIEYAEKINERIDKLVDVREEILSAIAQIKSSTLRSILTMRYIEFKSWERIADNLSYSRRQVERLNGQALLVISKIINKK